MTQQEKIKEVIEKYGYNSRKFQYLITSILTGVDEETCRTICSIQRDIRQILPKDEVGEEKEKEWHKPDYVHQQENEWDKLFKSLRVGL